MGSLVSFITSDEDNSLSVLALEVGSFALPGGFAKDLVAGLVADAVRATSFGGGVGLVVPQQRIAVRCGRCGAYTNRYVVLSALPACSTCATRELSGTGGGAMATFVVPAVVQEFHAQLAAYSPPSVSAKYTRFRDETPAVSEKFWRFRQRRD